MSYVTSHVHTRITLCIRQTSLQYTFHLKHERLIIQFIPTSHTACTLCPPFRSLQHGWGHIIIGWVDRKTDLSVSIGRLPYKYASNSSCGWKKPPISDTAGPWGMYRVSRHQDNESHYAVDSASWLKFVPVMGRRYVKAIHLQRWISLHSTLWHCVMMLLPHYTAEAGYIGGLRGEGYLQSRSCSSSEFQYCHRIYSYMQLLVLFC